MILPPLIRIDVPPAVGPCIYFLFDGDEVVYVGQTIGSFLSRVESHRRRKVFDRVEILSCEIDDLLRVEMQWIMALKPRYNREHLSWEQRRGGSPCRVPYVGPA